MTVLSGRAIFNDTEDTSERSRKTIAYWPQKSRVLPIVSMTRDFFRLLSHVIAACLDLLTRAHGSDLPISGVRVVSLNDKTMTSAARHGNKIAF